MGILRTILAHGSHSTASQQNNTRIAQRIAVSEDSIGIFHEHGEDLVGTSMI